MLHALIDFCRHALAQWRRRGCSLNALRLDNPECYFDLWTSRRAVDAALDEMYLWRP
jgi:hypothetical protein